MYKIVIFFEDLLKAFTLDFSYKKRFYKMLKFKCFNIINIIIRVISSEFYILSIKLLIRNA